MICLSQNDKQIEAGSGSVIAQGWKMERRELSGMMKMF